MNLGRIFANAIARRVAYVLVAMALAWLGLGETRAQSSDRIAAPNEGAAYSMCISLAQPMAGNGATPKCPKTDPAPCFEYGLGNTTACATYRVCVWSSANGYSCDNKWVGFLKSTSCLNQPQQTFTHADRIPSGSHGCSGGCEFAVANNGDGTYTRFFGTTVCSVLPECLPGEYLHPGTSLCMSPEEQCSTNETKNPKTGVCEQACPAGMHADTDGLCVQDQNECPAGNVRAPSGQCLPGDGQCAAGEARRPNGTCGRDSDGDGQADEDDDNPDNDPDRETASGGDSCNAPPSCSGGPIDCLQVKIQWRIDCNTRKNENISGGACGAMPVCTGEKCRALEYSQLLMQWRTACALEKLDIPAAGEGGDGEKIKPDFEAFAGASDGANPDDSIFLPDGDAEGFNQSLISYGAGALGWNFTVDGQQFALPQQITDFIAVLRWLIIAAATLVGIAIAWGRS